MMPFKMTRVGQDITLQCDKCGQVIHWCVGGVNLSEILYEADNHECERADNE